MGIKLIKPPKKKPQGEKTTTGPAKPKRTIISSIYGAAQRVPSYLSRLYNLPKERGPIPYLTKEDN
jgi:hypothetical protein